MWPIPFSGLVITLHFFLRFVLTFEFEGFLEVHYDVSFFEAYSTETASQGKAPVVFASNRQSPSLWTSTSENLFDFECTSFSRLRTSSLHCESNAETECSMEVLALQAATQAQCILLPDVPASMAVSNGPLLHPWRQTAADPGSCLPTTLELPRKPTLSTRRSITTEPEIAQKVSESKEKVTTGWKRERCCRFWASYAVPILSAYAVAGVHGESATPAAEWTTSSMGPSWCTSWHDAHGEHDQHGADASCADYPASPAGFHTIGYAYAVDANTDPRSPAERAAHVPAEEIRRSTSGCSTTCSIAVQEARKASHQRSASCSQNPRRSPYGPRGSIGGAHTTHQLLEVFSGRGSEELDRLCKTVRATRASAPGQDFGCPRAIPGSKGVPRHVENISWPSDGDQRRGGDDGRFRNICDANHGEHPEPFQLLDETLQRGRIDSGRGTVSEETQNRGWLRGRRCQVSLGDKAAFQLGGLYLTLWYCSRKPDLFDLPATSALKWSHSVMREPDFCCECGAREAAQKLALEMQLDGLHGEVVPQCSPSLLRTDKRSNLHVGFADQTELRMSFEDEWTFQDFRLPSDYFAVGVTPWSGCPKIAEMKLSRFHVQPWFDAGAARSCDSCATSSEPRIASSSSTAFMSNMPRKSFDSPDGLPHQAVADPRILPGSISSPENQSIAVPNGILQYKITDNYFDNPDSRARLQPEEPDPDVIPDIQEAPRFAQDLFAIGEQTGIFTDPDSDGILRLRTWYLHHQNFMVNFHSRIVEIEDDWRRWANDIIGSWRSHLQAGADIFFHLVTPDPYRGYLQQEVHCDIILTQGNELPRRAGLITVDYHGDQADPHIYAVAGSLELVVSGGRLAEVADADQWCLNTRHRCSISMGWQRIPFDFHPGFQVANGNAFTILVVKPYTQENRAVSHDDGSHSHQLSEHDYEDFSLEFGAQPSPRRPPSASSSSSHPESEVGVHIFRLDQPDAHCYLRWRDYRQILHDVAHCLAVQRNDVVALHYLQAHPVGIHLENERAVIIQSFSDIRAASTEQLVLLDLEIHEQALPTGLLVPPTVSRRVMKIISPLHRSQLLMLLGLNDYCELHGDKCIVFENNQIWPANDRTNHPLTHGAYLRIQVPPPADPSLATATAIEISREFALEPDRGHFFAFCQGNLPESLGNHHDEGDEQSLFQQSIRGFVDSCGAWQTQWAVEHWKVTPGHVVQPSIPLERRDQQPQQLPQRPHSSFFGRDFDTLSNLFASSSIIECEEEGPIAYVDTWYIHHINQRQCRSPRAVKLFQDPASWLEDILEPWRDIIDQENSIMVYLVRPTPPCTQMECILAHFIIEQAPRPELIVGLVSAHESNFRGAIIDHKAFSMSPLVTARSVIRQADLQARCNGRNCVARRGALPFDDIDPDIIEPGTNIVIFIRESDPFASSSNLETDVTGFMQRPPETTPSPATVGGFTFNPNAAAFCPGQAPLNVQPETIQDLHAHWTRTAFSWEGESASTSVLTWFVDHYHPQMRTCWQPRAVRLYEDFDTWEHEMKAAWNDIRLPGAPILFHLVLPAPPNTGHQIAAHVLLVQNPQDALSSSVVTVFDVNAGAATFTRQLAITTQERLLLEHVIFGLGFEGRCLYPGAPSICEAWIGSETLRLGRPHPARDGDGIIFQISPRPNFQQYQAQAHAATNLLQIGTQLRVSRERRLTHGLVAHTHGPLHDASPPQGRAIKLMKVSSDLPSLPSYIEVPDPPSVYGIQLELAAFGINCEVLLVSNEQVALCFSRPIQQIPSYRHVVYVPQHEPWEAHLHTIVEEHMSDLEHMRHLYRLGYEKAVILREVPCGPCLSEIHFTEASGDMLKNEPKQRALPPWPIHQSQRAQGPMFHPAVSLKDTQCLLNCGVTSEDLLNFFTSSRGTLCTTFEGLDLPEICQLHFETLKRQRVFDRLVIYVDGSSQARSRHIAPQLNEETGSPDAWCFLVLGETYTSNTTSEISLIGWSAHQVRCDPKNCWYAGADRIGSAIAEREALMWAMLWRIGQNSNIPTLFRSDSMLALQQARGEIGSLDCDMSFQSLRGCAQILEAALAPGDLVLEHVPGHAGDPYNEFCDWGAKREGSLGFFLKRPDMDFTTWRKLLPFLWMLFDQTSGLPHFQGSGFDVSPPELPEIAPPCQTASKPLPRRPFEFVLSIATGNVLSLGTGPAGFAGKLDYLRSQFAALHLNFFGVQETRATEGSSLRDGILRLSSGAERGQGGVELWCNLSQPIASCQGKSIYLAKKHFTVVHKDPRRLIVHVMHESFDAWFFVGYAPHSGHSFQERELWWTTSQELLTGFIEHQTPLFVCVDANAGPGEADGTHILLPGFRTSSGSPLLRNFLVDLQLCAPITSTVHEGTKCTWTSPAQEEFTIDYVLIPQSWIDRCSRSCVLNEFDLGNKVVDHAVHAIELQWQQDLSPATVDDRRALDFDRNGIQQHLKKALTPTVIPSWTNDVETHLGHINRHFHQQLRQHCPRPRQGPRRPYISEEVWQHRQQKLDHKSQLKTIRSLLRTETIARIFKAWREPQDWQLDQSFNFGTTLRIGILKHGLGFRRQSAILKVQIQQNKGVVLQEVLNQFTPHTAASEIQQQLRPFIGPSCKLKQGLAPLPMIKDAQGNPCTSQVAVRNRWIEFFSEMEGGERVDALTQRKLWRSNLAAFRNFALDIPITEMPSLTELEHTCRQVAAGKASGMDGIPSEMIKYCPSVVARQLYSLLLKIALHGQEPLEHKGGYLIPIWKGKLSKDCCQAFRSILISSMLGKTIHKSLRSKQTDMYQRYLHPQQLGGRKSISVVLGGHLVRAFMRLFAARGQPTAIIFIDLQEAFYRVVRPLAISGQWTDELIAAMAQRLQLNHQILHDLYAHLNEPSAIEQAQLNGTAQKAIQALHSDTFFALPGQDDRVRTRHGTRPGDSYADVVFGYLMARVLKSFAGDLEHANILTQIPNDPSIDLHSRGFQDVAEPPQTLLGPCWMDDLAIPLTAGTNQELLSNLCFATSSILDNLRAHAMTPNLAKGKTEILFKPRGAQTKTFRKQLFGPQASGYISAIGEYDTYKVNLVNAYVHLGGLTHASGDLRREIRRRIAIAHQSFNKHRKLIYQNDKLLMSRRVEIFSSLILSRLLFGAETWYIHDVKTKEHLHCAIIKLLKRLLRCAADEHITDEEVLHKVAMPTPATLLRVKRLSYVSALLNNGPSAHWGLLNQDQEWLDLVRDDLQWMGDQLANSCSLGNPFDHTDRWIEIMKFHRGYWKRLIKRAREHSVLLNSRNFICAAAHLRVRACLQEHQIWPASSEPFSVRPPPAGFFGCMLCGLRCKSFAGEGAHMNRTHGQVHPVRTLMDGTQCGACLKEYFTFGKLKTHLIYADHCRQQLIGRRLQVRPTSGHGSSMNEALHLAWDGKLPPLQAEGPHLPDVLPKEFETAWRPSEGVRDGPCGALWICFPLDRGYGGRRLGTIWIDGESEDSHPSYLMDFLHQDSEKHSAFASSGWYQPGWAEDSRGFKMPWSALWPRELVFFTKSLATQGTSSVTSRDWGGVCERTSYPDGDEYPQTEKQGAHFSACFLRPPSSWWPSFLYGATFW